MRILVIAGYHYQGTLYPTAIFIHEQMLAYARAGHEVKALVTIVCGKKDDYGRRITPSVWRQTVDGIEHIFMRRFSFSNYGHRGSLNLRCARATLKRHMEEILDGWTPDVIHGQALGNAYLGELLRERTGAALVVTNHGETRCDLPWRVSPGRIAPMADRADAVICVSSVLERQLRELGVKTRLGTILNGFRVIPQEAAGEPPPVSLNYTGWLQELKKLDISLTAFAALKRQYPDAAFTIVGRGRTEKEDRAPRKLVEQLDLEDSVSFLGYLDNAAAISEMGKSRFFVMPSHPEGFGVAYLEAMSMGCVTIGTEGQGIADLIVSGENGFLVPPDDPEAIVKVISWCVEHPQEADRIAERGRREAMSLTWDKNAAQYVRLFRTLREEDARCG
ncbi:glycosyltransferase family 4 protein [uncultured Oscillibacter sp.]|uniref:glycosyltransferase family 4 protein n=1 Tax=uncultured Oscillibacter sp. TaxID=876091 RepID=UPI002637CD45|nr:glycosyltransferase family 4 protein [uncultured Oscillibacter sp.]